jgi:hypothetical protein
MESIKKANKMPNCKAWVRRDLLVNLKERGEERALKRRLWN